ncbi:MAG: hypothetical protein HW410_1276 [Nitrosarchaeum sp.]|nr:hypothetical protein [Nitrosarchaeum sp.]
MQSNYVFNRINPNKIPIRSQYFDSPIGWSIPCGSINSNDLPEFLETTESLLISR